MDSSVGSSSSRVGKFDDSTSPEKKGQSLKDKLRTKKQRYDAFLRKQVPVKTLCEKDAMVKILLQSMAAGSKTTTAYIGSDRCVGEVLDLLFCTEINHDCARYSHAAWGVLTVDSTAMLDVMTDLKKPHLERFCSFLDQEQTLCTGKPPSPSDPVPVWVVPNVFYYFSTTFRRWLLARPEIMYDYIMTNSKKMLERLMKNIRSVEIVFVIVSILKTEKKLPKEHAAHQWCLDTVLPFLFDHFAKNPEQTVSAIKELLLGLSINRDWQFDVFHAFIEILITKYFHIVFSTIIDPKTTCDGMEIYYASLSYTTTTNGKGPQLLVPLTKQCIANIESLKKMLGAQHNLVAQHGLLIVNQQLQRGGVDIVQATLPVIVTALFKYPRRTVFSHTVSQMLQFLFKNERYALFHTQLLKDLKFLQQVEEAQKAGIFQKHVDWGLYLTKVLLSVPDSEKASNQSLLQIEKAFKQRTEIPIESRFNISLDLRKQQQIASQAKLSGKIVEESSDKDKKSDKEEKSKDKDKKSKK